MGFVVLGTVVLLLLMSYLSDRGVLTAQTYFVLFGVLAAIVLIVLGWNYAIADKEQRTKYAFGIVMTLLFLAIKYFW